MVGEFLPTPLIFALGDTVSHTTWTLYNRQQANFGMCYVVTRAYSLGQQNARQAYAGRLTMGFAMHLVCLFTALQTLRYLVLVREATVLSLVRIQLVEEQKGKVETSK